MTKIYTKTGDDGTTGLIGGTRVKKNHPRLEIYGAVDELSSFLGQAISLVPNPDFVTTLTKIQKDLFSLCTVLADPRDNSKSKNLITEKHIIALESQIDAMEKSLPPLKAFILPGGTQTSATLHVCRTICRRAERLVVASADDLAFDPVVITYLNRLSDYLFVAARYANHLENHNDTPA